MSPIKLYTITKTEDNIKEIFPIKTHPFHNTNKGNNKEKPFDAKGFILDYDDMGLYHFPNHCYHAYLMLNHEKQCQKHLLL